MNGAYNRSQARIVSTPLSDKEKRQRRKLTRKAMYNRRERFAIKFRDVTDGVGVIILASVVILVYVAFILLTLGLMYAGIHYLNTH